MVLDPDGIAYGLIPLVLGADGCALRTVRDGVEYNRQQGIRQQVSGRIWEGGEMENEDGDRLEGMPSQYK